MNTLEQQIDHLIEEINKTEQLLEQSLGHCDERYAKASSTLAALRVQLSQLFRLKQIDRPTTTLPEI